MTLQTLDSYLPIKPKFCYECGFWRFNQCKIGYTNNKNSKSCRQAISKKDLKKARLTP
jgi:hypothetical protein